MKNHLKVIDDTKDTYSDEYECKNCWHSFQVDIPKGITKDKYRKTLRAKWIKEKTKCSRCGCLFSDTMDSGCGLLEI